MPEKHRAALVSPRGNFQEIPSVPREEDLPRTQNLALRIKRDILERAAGRIFRLWVDVTAHNTIVLSGTCRSYYSKQLAQHAAMQLAAGGQVENRIQVL